MNRFELYCSISGYMWITSETLDMSHFVIQSVGDYLALTPASLFPPTSASNWYLSEAADWLFREEARVKATWPCCPKISVLSEVVRILSSYAF